MLKMLNAFFGLFGYALVPTDSDVIRLSLEMLHVSEVARPVVAKLERRSIGSPEYRRHEAYAKLLKRFPEVPAMDVSVAIEHALRKHRGIL